MASTCGSAPKTGRFSIRRLRTRWILIAIALLANVTVAVCIGWQLYWRYVSHTQIRRLGGHFIVAAWAPLKWLQATYPRSPLEPILWKLAPPVEVILRKTKVTDDDLMALENLTSLEVIYLDNTPITDAGLTHLKSMRRLRKLSVSGTSMTDAGLSHVAGLSSLREVNLTETQVTFGGVADLHRASPRLKIRVAFDESALRNPDADLAAQAEWED